MIKRAFLICSLVIASAPSGAAEAQSEPVETFDYTVVAGDSCGRIAQRFYGAWRRFDVILRFNPRLTEGVQRGACGPFLRPGVVLTLPRVYVEGGPQGAPAATPTTPRAPDPDATITRTFRDVEAAEPAASDWQRARRGTPLWRGWRVNTLGRSAADVTFRDASRIALRENTLVVIYGNEALARRETASATLERGQLRSRLAELRLQVETPSATAELASGSALVGVDPEGTARVSNFEGDAATVRGRAGGRVAVREGFGSKILRGARPSRPRPLPPAPAWIEGPTRFVGVAPYGATVVGAWAAVPVARRYRVEITTGEGDVVAATEVSSEVTRFELHRFPEGRYRVRVSTIDGDFFESRPSEHRAIEVALGRVDVGADDEVLPDPSEEPTPPVVVLGARFTAPDGARCGIGDGEPSATLPLAPVGMQEVRCVDAEGNAASRFAVDVRAPELRVEAPAVARGGRARVVLRGALLPTELRLRGEGIDVPFEAEGDAWVASFEPAEDAESIALEVVAGELVLAQATVEVSATPESRETPTPIETPTSPAEAPVVLARPPTPFSAVGHPDVIALRDAPGDDLALSIGIGSLGDQPGHDAHLRLDASLALTFVEQLRATVGIARDFAEVGDRIARRGDGDLRFELDATSRFEGPLRVGGGAHVWLPTGRELVGARTLGVTRVGGAVDVDYALGDFLLRTRQGGLFDAGDGLRAWASTYGVSWRALDQLHLGVEAQLTIGQDTREDDLVVLASLGLGAEARFGAAAFTLGARVGFGDDTVQRVGQLTILLGWRVSFDETMP